MELPKLRKKEDAVEVENSESRNTERKQRFNASIVEIRKPVRDPKKGLVMSKERGLPRTSQPSLIASSRTMSKIPALRATFESVLIRRFRLASWMPWGRSGLHYK
jgi:hypothetical protein